MKKLPCFLTAVLATIITSFAAKIPSLGAKEINTLKSIKASITIQQTAATSSHSISALIIRDLQKSLGRKLSLKEKISWYLFKRQFKQEEPTATAIRRANTNAVLGFSFSLAGLLLFPLFLIPGLILSLNALTAEKVDLGILTRGNYSLAKAGKIMCFVGFGLIIFVVALVLVYIAALG